MPPSETIQAPIWPRDGKRKQGSGDSAVHRAFSDKRPESVPPGLETAPPGPGRSMYKRGRDVYHHSLSRGKTAGTTSVRRAERRANHPRTERVMIVMMALILPIAAICLLAFPAAASAAGSAGRKPRVMIITTGGTIASAAESSTQLTDYTASAFSADQLIRAVPSLEDFAQITAEQVTNIGSSDMTIEHWLTLAGRINDVFAKGEADGIVVTHGTDTMEETAYFLNLVVKSDKPVVLVGSMRPATAISADGPLNLLQAVAVAGSAEAAGHGVLVVMNGEINGARDMTKTNTLHVETFQSHDFGFLGYVVDNKPEFYRRSTRKHTKDAEFDVSGLTALPKVEIVYNYLNSGHDALNGVLAGKPEGVVYSAVGNGTVPEVFREPLAKAAREGVLVVRATRVPTGSVTTRAMDAEYGWAVSDNLTPPKARILLMLALTRTKDLNEVKRMFKTY